MKRCIRAAGNGDLIGSVKLTRLFMLSVKSNASAVAKVWFGFEKKTAEYGEVAISQDNIDGWTARKNWAKHTTAIEYAANLIGVSVSWPGLYPSYGYNDRTFTDAVSLFGHMSKEGN